MESRLVAGLLASLVLSSSIVVTPGSAAAFGRVMPDPGQRLDYAGRVLWHDECCACACACRTDGSA